MCKKCHKPICSIEMFRFLLISIVELKNGYFCLVLPVFWAFPVLGPIITSLASSRSNTDGPSDRKCPKNGQNLAEIPIFLLNNGNRQKPKNFNATTSYFVAGRKPRQTKFVLCESQQRKKNFKKDSDNADILYNKTALSKSFCVASKIRVK